MKIALTLQDVHKLHGGDLTSLLEVSRQAETAGFDHLLIGDHVLMAGGAEGQYAGALPVPVDFDQLEPLTLFAGIAAVTTRIRMITGILLGPLRPAVFLAKQAATLDVLSKGRLDLGLGVGWQWQEYAASGVPFEGRNGRLEDQIRACKILWNQAPATFESATVSFTDVWSRPFPAQAGGPPVWFGCNLSDRNLTRIAELGAGWVVTASTDQKPTLAANVARLRDALARAGRDPSGFPVCFPITTRYESLQQMTDEAAELTAAGATLLTYRAGFTCRTPDELETLMEHAVATRAALGGTA